MKRFALFSALLAVTTGGCMKIHTDFVLMPDGSGRMAFTIAMKAEEGKMEENPMTMMGDPDEFLKNMPGIVAMTKPSMELKDGWHFIRFSLYFDDINKVKFMENEKEKQSFSLRKEKDGYVFEITGSMIAKDAQKEDPSANPEANKQMQEMMAKMMEGFEYGQSVRLPGKVTSMEGFQTMEGNTASFLVKDTDMKEQEDRKKFESLKSFKVTCGPSDISDADQAEFKKELDQARKDWTVLKEEWKKSGAKKDENSEKDHR